MVRKSPTRSLTSFRISASLSCSIPTDRAPKARRWKLETLVSAILANDCSSFALAADLTPSATTAAVAAAMPAAIPLAMLFKCWRASLPKPSSKPPAFLRSRLSGPISAPTLTPISVCTAISQASHKGPPTYHSAYLAESWLHSTTTIPADASAKTH